MIIVENIDTTCFPLLSWFRGFIKRIWGFSFPSGSDTMKQTEPPHHPDQLRGVLAEQEEVENTCPVSKEQVSISTHRVNLDLDYTPEVFETACKKSLLLALLIVYFHNDNNPSISGLVVKMEDPAYHPLAGHQVGAPVSLLLALSMVGGWVLGGFFCKLQAHPFDIAKLNSSQVQCQSNWELRLVLYSL